MGKMEGWEVGLERRRDREGQWGRGEWRGGSGVEVGTTKGKVEEQLVRRGEGGGGRGLACIKGEQGVAESGAWPTF